MFNQRKTENVVYYTQETNTFNKKEVRKISTLVNVGVRAPNFKAPDAICFADFLFQLSFSVRLLYCYI